MGVRKHFYQNQKEIRDRLVEAWELAQEIHRQEQKLIRMLKHIDQRTWYVRFGYNSLSGFVRCCLKFSRTQTQRIVTQVRRLEPTANFVDGRGVEDIEPTKPTKPTEEAT